MIVFRILTCLKLERTERLMWTLLDPINHSLSMNHIQLEFSHWENYRFYTSEHVDIKNIYIYIYLHSILLHLFYLLKKAFKTWSSVSCHGGFGRPRPQPAGSRVLGERDTSTSAMGL